MFGTELSAMQHQNLMVEKELFVSGRIVRIAKLRHEWFDFLEDPRATVRALQKSGNGADLFTFLQDLNDTRPPYRFYREAASAAVLPVTTYEAWWQSLDPRVRNKIRKAQKAGVELRDVTLDEDFARDVEIIYNESPIRQGRNFWHFGQSAASIHEELSSLFGRCYFVGAYLRDELIGFAKLCHGTNILRTVHIIGKLAQRDKPVQDGLIARAVEICEEQGISSLQYGSWSSGSLGAFKIKRGFMRVDYSRYYVPLTYRGRIVLRLGLHHGLKDRLPADLRAPLTALRLSWNKFRHGTTLRRPAGVARSP